MLMKSLILILFSCLSIRAMAVDGVLGNYVSDAEIYDITARLPRQAEVTGVAVRLDTRDGIQCGKIRNFIRRHKLRVSKFAVDDLCIPPSASSPYKDLVVFQTEENQPLLNFIKSGLSIGMTAYQSKSSRDPEREQRLEAAAKSDSFLLSPIFAAFLSESVTHLRGHIQDNGGRLGDSKFFGSTILVITNPAESIKNIFNGLSKYKSIKSADSQLLLRDYSSELQAPGPYQRGQTPDLNALEFRMVFHYK